MKDEIDQILKGSINSPFTHPILVELITLATYIPFSKRFSLKMCCAANEDYQPLWTQLVFGPLDTATRELTLQLVDDSVRESTEEFRVQITLDPLNSAGVSVGQDTTSIQIEDDDSMSQTYCMF